MATLKKSRKNKRKLRYISRKQSSNKPCSCSTRRRRTKKQVRKVYRGGGLIPQDMVNFGRGVLYNANNLVSSYRGLPKSPSYLPTIDHPINKNISYINVPMVDVMGIRQDAINSVLK